MARPAFFLNSSSDATLLRTILEAADQAGTVAPSAAELEADVAHFAMQPLFVRGVSDVI